MEDTTGFCKLIGDPRTRTVIGAHIIGYQASMLVQLLVQGMHLGNTADEMAVGQVWIHPALPEVVEQALLKLIDAFDGSSTPPADSHLALTFERLAPYLRGASCASLPHTTMKGTPMNKKLTAVGLTAGLVAGAGAGLILEMSGSAGARQSAAPPPPRDTE